MARYRNTAISSKNNKNSFRTTIYNKVPKRDTDRYFIAQEGDRCDNLANRFYKDPDLWWIITIANPDKIRRDSFFIKPGTQIRIPIDLDSIMEDFEKVNKPLM